MHVPSSIQVEVLSPTDLEEVVRRVRDSLVMDFINHHHILTLHVSRPTVSFQVQFVMVANTEVPNPNHNHSSNPLPSLVTPSRPAKWFHSFSRIFGQLESGSGLPSFHKSRIMLILRLLLCDSNFIGFLFERDSLTNQVPTLFLAPISTSYQHIGLSLDSLAMGVRMR